MGQTLVLTGLTTLTWGVIEGPHAGWGSGLILGLFVTAALALLAFVLYEPSAQGSAAGPEVLPQRAVLKRNGSGAERLLVLWRLSFSEHAVPPAGARIFRLSYGAIHAAAGDRDDGVRAMVRTAGRKPTARGLPCWLPAWDF